MTSCLSFLRVLLLLFLCWPLGSFGFSGDSSGLAAVIHKSINYKKKYNFIQYDQNHLEWANYQSVAPLFAKLQESYQRKFQILHIGDSHVHYDLQCHEIRTGLQNIFGAGGRGFASPYSMAGTHATYDYTSSHKGRWTGSKNVLFAPPVPLGITGISGRTNDVQAGFKINFLSSASIKEHYRTLRIYCQPSIQSFDLKLEAPGLDKPIMIDCHSPNGKNYVEVQLPVGLTQLDFSMIRSTPEQNFFELYGIFIESDQNSGIVYSSVGVNGANFNSLLKSQLLAPQLAEMQPDLVILDLGINDFYTGNTVDASVERNLKRVIQMIRAAAPQAAILITNPQDAYFGRRNVTACVKFAEISRKIAFENNCIFYDYFTVSGGKYAMLKWQGHGLAKSDRIHLSNNGYKVKGELYLNALLNSFYTSLTSPALDNFIVQNKKLNLVTPDDLPEEKEQKSYFQKVSYQNNATTPTLPKQVHTVKRGESLGYLALYYGTNIAQLKQWNGLKNHFIYPGQKLTVYSKKKPPQVPKAAATNNAIVKNGRTYHKVSGGDTLWQLARKYNTTVENIKQLNKLQDDKLSLGMQLIVK